MNAMRSGLSITKAHDNFKRLEKLEEEWNKLILEQAGEKQTICWGVCINEMKFVPIEMAQCSVGLVRIERSGRVDNKSSFGCGSCPYFVSHIEISNMADDYPLRRKLRAKRNCDSDWNGRLHTKDSDNTDYKQGGN